jgi:GTP-binding protein
MKILEAEFIIGADYSKIFPITELPEVAFSGRSNVGKSSLLNNLVHRKNLAHTSATPGKTQQINFYKIENKWMFADLPGFGFAVISKKEREKWKELNFEYLRSRENLKLVCYLIDSRHDPMEQDMALIEFFENNNRKYLIILTKCDKISKSAIDKRKTQIEYLTQYCKNCVEVLPFSTVEAIGNTELLAIIKKHLLHE